jgi:hypothetical protein
MKFWFFISGILLILISCEKNNNEDTVKSDFTGNYQCTRYYYSTYYIPQIDSTIYQHDTENVVIDIVHGSDPDSIIITFEEGGKIKFLVSADSTFTNYDPPGPIISGMTTFGAFLGNDSIEMKISGWSDTQYYREFQYYGAKTPNFPL